MATPDRDSLAEASSASARTRSRRATMHCSTSTTPTTTSCTAPQATSNRDEIKAYFAALRDSFTDFTISRAQILVDGNFVSARTVMAGRVDQEFAYTPIGLVEPNGQRVQWELINIFRYADEGHLLEEWVQTDTYEFLRQLSAVAR
jgi:predicted ester cyclase